MYSCFSRLGGGDKAGVGGGGAEGDSRFVGPRLRGMSLGSFALRSGGGEEAAAGGDCGCVIVLGGARRIGARAMCWEPRKLGRGIPRGASLLPTSARSPK